MPRKSTKLFDRISQKLSRLRQRYPSSEWGPETTSTEGIAGSLFMEVEAILMGEAKGFELPYPEDDDGYTYDEAYDPYGISSRGRGGWRGGNKQGQVIIERPAGESIESTNHVNVMPANVESGMCYPKLIVVCNDSMDLGKLIDQMCHFLYRSDGTTVRVEFVTTQWKRTPFLENFTTLEDLCKKYSIDFNFWLFSDFDIRRIPLPPRFY